MQITSNSFILFLIIGLLLYYIVPRRFQWAVLLVISYAYYMIVSVPAVLFLLYSTIVTYGCAMLIAGLYAKAGPDRVSSRTKARKIVVLGLIMDFGMLAVLKYSNFMILNLNMLFRSHLSLLDLMLPLGISYYTFSSAGYLLDVYWERIHAETDFFHYALFVSFFPQMLQGPINRWHSLGTQFSQEHAFSLHQFKQGMERILWGVFKKMILADWAAVYVDAVFADPDHYSGIILIGQLLYAVQLYGDFSGGIDVMIGVSQLFGITLEENFNRPYFATSLADFWRRWHMTLGLWMKDYVMYPLTLSKGMNRLGKKCKKVLGRKKGRLIPICISNIIVFLLVGIWHGSSWGFIIWGLYNGLIIAFSNYFADRFAAAKKACHIRESSAGYHIFMVVRTFIITMIGNYVDLTHSFSDMFRMMRYAVTRFMPSQILEISSGKLGTAYTPTALLILAIGCILLFLVSFLQERGVRIRDTLSKWPLPVEFALCLVLLICIPMFSPMAMARGFIYAQF